MAVGDALPGGQPLHVAHPGPQRQRRLAARGTAAASSRLGRDAVDGDAGPHQVAAGGRSPRQPGGGVGGVDERAAGSPRAPARARRRRAARAAATVVGSAGSSARARWVHRPSQRSSGWASSAWTSGTSCVRPGADAVHAGVHLEVHPHGRARRSPGPPSPARPGTRRCTRSRSGASGPARRAGPPAARTAPGSGPGSRPGAAPRPPARRPRTGPRRRPPARPGPPPRRRGRSRRP